MEESNDRAQMEEMHRRGDGRLVAGAILVVIGIGLLAIQLTDGAGESLALLFIGGVFLAGYLYRRAYGLLIPGAILLGLGVGTVLQRAFPTTEGLNSIGLGLGFLSIYAIDWLYSREERWWPLIPGGILVLVGLADTNDALAQMLQVGWPFILILVGLLLLFGSSLRNR